MKKIVRQFVNRAAPWGILKGVATGVSKPDILVKTKKISKSWKKNTATVGFRKTIIKNTEIRKKTSARTKNSEIVYGKIRF